MDPARQLLQRYLDEIASPADLAELARLLPRHPDLADDLIQATHSEALLESHFSERRTLSAVAAVLAIEPAPARFPRFLVWKWSVAAMLLVTTGLLFGFWIGRLQPAPGAVVSGRVHIDGVEVVRVPDNSWIEVVGEDIAVIRLPDGSRAELGPASAAVLRQQTPWSRKGVELDRGRAAFHIERGRNRFRVDTPLGSVSTRDAEFRVELQTEEEEGDEPLSNQSTLVLVVAALVGQVEVDTGGKHYLLAAGQKQSFAGKSASNKKQPAFTGTIVEASAESLTVESPAGKKGGKAVRKQFKFTDKTAFVYFGVGKEGEKPTVGYLARVWLVEGSNDTLARVQLGLKQKILDGKVTAVATDAKSFTLERTGKGGTTISTEFKITENTKLVYKGADKGDKPTVGYFARALLKPGTRDTASEVIFSSKAIADAPSKKKPKTGAKVVKNPSLSGIVKALAADGKSFTLALPKTKTGDEPAPMDIQIGDNTKITAGKQAAKLVVGQTVSVWLDEGSRKVAATVQIGQSSGKPNKKPTPNEGKPTLLDGKVAAVAADAKSFTLERTGKDGTPSRSEITIADDTKVGYKDVDKGDKPVVGYFVRVVLIGKRQGTALKIVFSGKPFADAPAEKKKPGKNAALSGTVQALATDGKSFTLLPPRSKKGGEPTPIIIQIGEDTKITTGKGAAKLAVGQAVTVWLKEGSTNSAATVQVGNAEQPNKRKPDKVKKPAPDANEQKPNGSKKPKEPAKPARDSAPTAAVIDAVTDRPIGVKDFMGSVCQVLGIDHTKKIETPSGRPIRIVEVGEKLIPELIS